MKNRIRNHYFVLTSVAFILVLWGCPVNKAPEIVVGIDVCSLCRMVIDQPNQACGYFEDGKFLTFDSPGCLLQRYNMTNDHGPNGITSAYFADYPSGRLCSVDSIHFFLTDHIPTVMNARVLTFNNRSEISALKQHNDETITDWRGYWIERSEPDVRIEITVSDAVLSPQTVVCEKNQLVEWTFTPHNIKSAIELRVVGYEEAGKIVVTPDHSQVRLKMFADKPGAGFPIVRTSDNKPMGMVKVVGAHTEDEEEM